MTPWRLAAAALGLGILLGLTGGYKLYHGKVEHVVSDKAAPEVKLQGGAIIAKVEPTKVPLKPIPSTPKGLETVRRFEVDVMPNETTAHLPGEPQKPAEPIKVFIDLDRQADGHLRAVAYAEGGKVVAAVDIPMESAPIVSPKPSMAPKDLKWAAGGVYGATAYGDSAKGAFIDRDYGATRVGLELSKNSYALVNKQAWEARVKFGIRF